MERVEELLSCPVCLDRFKWPKILPCQHTFCLRPCLENIVQDNSVCCPACRACHTLHNGIKGLPANLMAVNLLDIPTQLKPYLQCKECETGDGDVAKCNHCDEPLCRGCIASHTLGLQQDLSHSLIQVTRLESEIAEYGSDLQERSNKLEENGRNVKCEISQSIERFLSELQSRKNCLFEEVDALVAIEIGSLQREQGELEVTMAALTAHRKDASEICERPLALQSTQEIQRLQSEILCLAEQSREHLQSNGMSSNEVRKTIKVTNRDEHSVLSAISNFGAASAHAQCTFGGELRLEGIQSECQQRDAQPSGQGEEASTPDTGNEEDSHVAEVLRRYRDKGKVSKCFGTKGDGVRRRFFHQIAGQLNGPRGISSTAADDIIVADFWNDRIQIFDVNGQVKGVIGSKGTLDGQFSCVNDVCVTSRGWIVASDELNHRIQIFNQQGRFVRKFGSKTPVFGSPGDGELNKPFGVATDDKGLIYVSDNHQVQVFSPDGEFVRKFGSDHLNKPRFPCVTSNGRVIVAGNHRVHVFDEYGRYLFQFGKKGRNTSQFNNPRGIATDQHGNIIVADRGNHRVQLFTSDGDFVTCFGSEGSALGQMKEVQGVCLLSDGGIAVCDSGNHRVQIF